MKIFRWKLRGLAMFGAGLCMALLIALGAGHGQAGARQGAAAGQTGVIETMPPVDPLRGPVDLGLTDPGLIGAIDIHEHLDPDSPGATGAPRSIDVFDQAALAKSRGLRGMVFKTHQDAASAGMAYMVRKHGVQGFEIFGRMASNFATGGVNVAALLHFSQIKGGYGRIYEMPTLDSYTSTRNEKPEDVARVRPWMLLMPEGTPKFIPTVKDGQLLSEVKHLIEVMSKLRTVDSNGAMVLATGHATPEEHILLANEGRRMGLQVLLTHGHQMPIDKQLEAIKTGAYLEYTGMDTARRNIEPVLRQAVDNIHKAGAEHIIFSTDCGQTTNPLPTDCMVLTIRALRALGITEHEIDLMYKVNPAKLLGLPPLEDASSLTTNRR